MNILKVINDTETQFNSLSNEHKAVKFVQECNNAMYLLKQNSFLMDIAKKNPESLQMAIYQMASIGLTLNPTMRQGYLVPYGGKNPRVNFLPGYCGLVHLAQESGSILWVKSEVVYDSDTFEYRGAGEKPRHEFDPFSDNRGDMLKAKGVYCVAKTKDSEYLVEMMSKSEVYSIRNRSESFKSGRKIGPWFSDEGEMWKKTVIRRAEKLWPKSKRLTEAVSVLNQNDGLIEAHVTPTEDKLKDLMNTVELIEGANDFILSNLVNHVNEKSKQAYESVEDFNQDDVNYSIEFLTPFKKAV
jgi:recombination protein RecT